VSEGALTLYRSELCPFSSAVRQALTELGLDFVAHQVEPWPSERAELRRVAGTDQIPVLLTEDGRPCRSTHTEVDEACEGPASSAASQPLRWRARVGKVSRSSRSARSLRATSRNSRNTKNSSPITATVRP